MKRLFLSVVLVVTFAGVFLRVSAAAAQSSNWTIDALRIDATVGSPGTVTVTELVDANFGSGQFHGIFVDIAQRVPCTAVRAGAQAPLVACPEGYDRVYDVQVLSVEMANGQPVNWTQSASGSNWEVKIGDPNRTVTGVQSYRVRYLIGGLLDSYSDHDELYWNATGTWQAPIGQASVTVRNPQGTTLQNACYEGTPKSTQTCLVESQSNVAQFTATRSLSPGEQLTIVAGWPRGVVNVQPPRFEKPPKGTTIGDFFALDWIEFAGMGLVAAGSVFGLASLWWRHGRDRRYRTLYYLTNDPSQETSPLFKGQDVVVEYLPPEDLRPAEMGLILDERADTLDVTATIIDLAVRGYLHITEIPKEGWLGHKDWTLTRVERESDLLPYEQELYESLFESGSEVTMSGLKNKFASRLGKVKSALYADGMGRKWFAMAPEKARIAWLLAGFGLIVVGAGLSLGAGLLVGRALIFVPVVVAGIILLVLSQAMARRTAVGSEALRRVLGFRLYVATAETRMQEFNEQQNIFARYLPFAIVFGCVEKWASAFKGLEQQAQASTAGWYTGTGAFQVMAFSAGLQGFASSVSTTMASTPGSSGGGSGFSGGLAGGGGGGGGGGAW